MTFVNVLIVGFGGFIGSIARYVTVKSIDQKLNASFPYGTLTVNVVGSFVLGLAYAWLIRKGGMQEQWRLLLGTGFCGGFTTFSAFAWENVSLIEGKMAPVAILYIIISLAAGLGAVFLGVWASRFL